MERTEIRKRIISYDIIRVCAITMVVLYHSAGHFLALSASGSTEYIFCKIVSSLTQPSVPLFVMLSGALMLNEDRNVSDKKIFASALNIWILLAIWSLIYAVFYYVVIPLIMGNPVSIAEFKHTAIYGNYHLWYLFMIIGLYLMTPLFRLFVKKENKKYIFGYIMAAVALQFILFAVPFADKYISGIRFGFLSKYVVYYFLGWYVTQIEIKHRKKIYAAGTAGCIVNIAVICNDAENYIHYNFFGNDSITILLVAIAVFVAINHKFTDIKSDKISKRLKTLSELSFGVYLSHDAVLTVVRQFTDIIGDVMAETAVNFVLGLTVSFFIVWIAHKIPIVKKIVRG